MAFNEAGGSFEDFHDWSQHGSNYKGRKDVLTMWESIKPSGGVTRRSSVQGGGRAWIPAAPRITRRLARAMLSPGARRSPQRRAQARVPEAYGTAAKSRQMTTDTFVAKRERAKGFGWFQANDPLTIRGQRDGGLAGGSGHQWRR